jgi:hypothetical protein
MGHQKSNAYLFSRFAPSKAWSSLEFFWAFVFEQEVVDVQGEPTRTLRCQVVIQTESCAAAGSPAWSADPPPCHDQLKYMSTSTRMCNPFLSLVRHIGDFKNLSDLQGTGSR